MTERLQAAFRAADRLTPAEQNDLAVRILAEIAPECVRHSSAWTGAIDHHGPRPAARV